MSAAPTPAVTLLEAQAQSLPLSHAAQWLCPARQQALARIQHPQARACSLTGDLLLYAAVRDLLPGVSLPPVRAAAPGGKPYLPDLPDVHLSLTHSGQTVVCALANVPVGIDLELPRPVRSGLVERFFTPQEQALVRREPDRFFDLWMAKEAVLKEIGCGIAGNLRQVSVSLGDCSHADAFGNPHALTRAVLPSGAVLLVSVPGTIPPTIQIHPFSKGDFCKISPYTSE